MASRPSKLHIRMIEVLQKHPEGMTSGQWRKELGIPPDEQTHLDRRKRDLKKWFQIKKHREGGQTFYVYAGKRKTPLDTGGISLKLKAEIFDAANERCGMCGKTIQRHKITLVIDHRIPRDWGGKTERENLWAICEDCNQGKKNHFASQDQSLMRRVMRHESVHVRLGELLKAFKNKPVSSKLLAFVARRDDWMKRTRELRYLGFEIKTSRERNPNGRVESSYTLTKDADWPADPSGWIGEYERRRAKRNRRSP
jgi:5-methylcytosine-specific restriction endonuclease McrA